MVPVADFDPSVTLTRDGRVAIITLNRSEHRNEINVDMTFDLA
ncbi:MAG TPA: enoyl-CoA hydratase, partial [Dehalococcoidia bacterium]|nr:enoyl-CoA hydratase [Dehalococcoidia bacterium]